MKDKVGQANLFDQSADPGPKPEAKSEPDPKDDPIAIWNARYPNDPHVPVTGPEADRLAWLREITDCEPLRLGTKQDGKKYLLWKLGDTPVEDIGAWLAWLVIDCPRAEVARWFLAQCDILDQGEIMREWSNATQEEFDEFFFNTEAALAESQREEAMSPEERKAFYQELWSRSEAAGEVSHE